MKGRQRIHRIRVTTSHGLVVDMSDQALLAIWNLSNTVEPSRVSVPLTHGIVLEVIYGEIADFHDEDES